MSSGTALGLVVKTAGMVEREIGLRPTQAERDSAARKISAASEANRRFFAFASFLLGLALIFCRPLYTWAMYVAHSDVHSHVLLVPFVSAYLIYIQWPRLPKAYSTSVIPALVCMALSGVALGAWWKGSHALDISDSLALATVGFVFLVWTGIFLFLGSRWFAAVAFPAAFLLFSAPLPSAALDWLEKQSTILSAVAAEPLFSLAQVPALRTGVVFQLPDITIRVAQECSGIRSSWALFLTSLVAAHLFLQTSWRQIALIAFVLPLAILRNAFRIVVIGWLCVHLGPEMIHSAIHKRGGPLFFAISIVPLLAWVWWLRRGEMRRLRGHQNPVRAT